MEAPLKPEPDPESEDQVCEQEKLADPEPAPPSKDEIRLEKKETEGVIQLRAAQANAYRAKYFLEYMHGRWEWSVECFTMLLLSNELWRLIPLRLTEKTPETVVHDMIKEGEDDKPDGYFLPTKHPGATREVRAVFDWVRRLRGGNGPITGDDEQVSFLVSARDEGLNIPAEAHEMIADVRKKRAMAETAQESTTEAEDQDAPPAESGPESTVPQEVSEGVNAPTVPANVFSLSGQGWRIGFAATEPVFYRDCKGARIIHELLLRQGQGVPIATLTKRKTAPEVNKEYSQVSATPDVEEERLQGEEGLSTDPTKPLEATDEKTIFVVEARVKGRIQT